MPETLLGQSPLTVLILVPAVVAALVWLVPPLRRLARPIGLVTSALVLAGAIALAVGFDVSAANETQFAQVADWIPAFGASYAVGVNGLGLVMVLLATLLVPVVIVAGWNEVTLPATVGDGDETAERKALDYRRAGWVALILVLEALMIAVFASRDIFLFYVVFEAMLIPVYFLIGVYGGANRRYAAIKFLLYSLAGGLLMLAAVIGYFFVGTDQGPQAFLLDQAPGLDAAGVPLITEMLLFLGFFIAFAIKAPMWPVHTWLPDAAQQATPGTSTLLVGVLDKVGTFGMIVLCLPLFPNAAAAAAPVIIVLALISILYGGLLAIGQNDMMRLIAFTSVSHFGFIVLGIFVGSATAVTGSMIYMVAHGVSTAGMFLVAGFLTQRGGTQDMGAYSGMQRITRVIAGTFLVSGLASLALPGLSGFVPEYLVLLGTFEVAPWMAIVAVLGVVLAALYILLAYQRVFTGPPSANHAGMPDLNGREKAVMGVLIAAMLVLGFYPAPVLDLLTPLSETVAALVTGGVA
ncbi:NADH-quinone oxidoreductase subunit M [Pseudactinotalea suaedae]|uniref:NADH-quinone oxidoreductase subunit M n=1 Tax=Pseudactinotalea suaedae TaxID=1524924 RepID=UPI0012E151BC|nr:NADH-quinone oxidoreductase subunit M [Pseudactinotalea suaedae]